MGRTFEITGDWLAYLLYAVMLVTFAVFALSLLWSRDSSASVVFAVFLGSLVIAIAVGLWRRKTGREADHLGTAEDLAYRPLAPGRMAKERWLKSIRLFSGGDDEED